MRARTTLEFEVAVAHDATGSVCGVDFDSLRDAVRQAHLSSPPEKAGCVARLSFGADRDLATSAVLSLTWDEDY